MDSRTPRDDPPIRMLNAANIKFDPSPYVENIWLMLVELNIIVKSNLENKLIMIPSHADWMATNAE